MTPSPFRTRRALLASHPRTGLAPAQPATGIGGRVRTSIRNFVVSRKMRKLSDVERLLVDEFRKLFESASDHKGAHLDDRSTFETACRLSHTLGYAFGKA